MKMNKGRPRKFEESDVLQNVINTFWRNGYAATSIDDLVAATKLGRQSLYRTFGGKRALFLLALQHYSAGVMSDFHTLLAGSDSAYAGIKTLLSVQEKMAQTPDKLGCLMANSFGQFLEDDIEVKALLIDHVEQAVDILASTLQRAQQLGELSANINTRSMARMIAVCLQGLNNFNRMGMPQTQVKETTDMICRLLESQ